MQNVSHGGVSWHRGASAYASRRLLCSRCWPRSRWQASPSAPRRVPWAPAAQRPPRAQRPGAHARARHLPYFPWPRAAPPTPLGAPSPSCASSSTRRRPFGSTGRAFVCEWPPPRVTGTPPPRSARPRAPFPSTVPEHQGQRGAVGRGFRERHSACVHGRRCMRRRTGGRCRFSGSHGCYRSVIQSQPWGRLPGRRVCSRSAMPLRDLPLRARASQTLNPES